MERKKAIKKGLNLGVEFALLVITATLGGYYLGKMTIGAAIGMVIGSIAGFLAMTYWALRIYRDYKE
ncbi:MAG: hypothetical protein BTN85_0597 [Candidatus Methanohalarchaeum thermophilum]|uniref:Uncharacterized protein n=1 Tax=Methanohalarchaeum thermophilum TaxID=1903181 RepID=A0A1Q6DUX2_METT1|nr:MAG: hypothetical protein BTN85_0597 [Candidatus Methanohalarchaeum thermophilum]